MLKRSLLAGAIMMSAAAIAQADDQPATQGLYSADKLMDAQVHLQNDQESIGEVEDLLFGDDMSLQAIVIEADDAGSATQDHGYVIQRGDFTVETSNNTDLDELEYRVTVNLDRNALEQQPTWSNDWWQDARQQASQTWEKTSDAAGSAWEDTRQATSNLLQRAGDALQN
ncbi:PRC-barrel domain containing protein [Kushneria sp. TE3]|uniref:PRC-barrel domain containing protein n=1 Tax=Kushneria sp. TE3 TaxID=3449832 RepID=UPI003F68264E